MNGTGMVVLCTGMWSDSKPDSMPSSDSTVWTEMESPPLLAWVTAAFAVGELVACWTGLVGRAADVAMGSAAAVGAIVACRMRSTAST